MTVRTQSTDRPAASAAAPPPLPLWRPAAWLLAVVWSIPAALSTLETVTFAAQSGRPIAVWRAFVGEAPQWYGWALCTPVIILLAERFPVHRTRSARNLLVHLAATIAAGGLIAVADAAANAWVRPSSRTFAASAGLWFLGQLPATFVAYAGILAAAYAIASTAQARERERRAADLEVQLRDAQMAALRMQLQPHFLFNSLNAIMALVRDQNTAAAVRAISLLGDVLRTAAGAGDSHETTLAQEVEFVSRYLEIERLRFGDRLQVHIDVPRTLHDARVPTLILQPFVENALKHGVLSERTGNAITIAAARSDGSLRLSVRDDGRGLSASSSTSGVGVSNARARLAAMYGDSARLTVANATDGPGVAVEIVLPFAS